MSGFADETILNPFQASLKAGIADISQYATVTFNRYTKITQPIDGSVFWVLIPDSAVQIAGSLHFSTSNEQRQDETIGINHVMFTSNQEITELNEVDPSILWAAVITTPSGVKLLVGFTDRDHFYQQAGVWHYRGDALYPTLSTQVVNSIEDIPTSPIVSNSLPLFLDFKWLYPSQSSLEPVRTYAAYLVPANAAPPYVSVFIDPNRTEILAASPLIGAVTSHPDPNSRSFETSLLAKDSVELTLYGFNNQQAIQYYNALIEHSLNPNTFGFMTMPTLRDAQRTQPEMNILAMKKTVIMDASYYQSTTNAITYRLIKEAYLKSITLLRGLSKNA